MCSGLMLVDTLSGWGGWSLWVTAMWGGFGILPQYMKLWNAGYSWRDILHRPAAPDAADAQGKLPAATTDEFGRQAGAINQARSDRQAILKILERLPASERKLLPDVLGTVDALQGRAESLGRTLQAMSGGVDEGALARIDDRMAATRRQPEGTEQDRQLVLLERQRQALTDLISRRRAIEEQLESCVLAMQNVRFDLLRLRSAGVAAVLEDLTHATQQARALSRDVDHAIAAAGEIREALREGPRA